MIHCILIHGAWHDSRCWEDVIKVMKKKGASVSAIDLPGHGGNQADFAKVTLDSYVDAVVAEASAYEEVVLVGHSMGGTVVAAAIERITEKAKRLVFVSGIIPSDGKSLSDRTRTFSQKGISTEMKFDFESHKVSLRKGQVLRGLLFNDCTEEKSIIGEKELQEQPLLPFSNKVSLGESFLKVPKLYVKCTLDKCILQQDQDKMALESRCDIVELESGHAPYISSPKELSEIILKSS